ncbi:hypothetical protein DB347_22755 [Opitutaceae bacterium EW11]|nr:hypothetical protein DB347_22755 [Opitutaceae bacterium EW11]
MRTYSLLVLAWLALITVGVRAEPEVLADPFEPPSSRFFSRQDKYIHPAEILPPIFYFPHTMLRGAVDGEVVALVSINDSGAAQRIAVLSATDERFIPAAVWSFKRARWEAGHGGSVFYYRALYLVEDFRNGRVQVGSGRNSVDIDVAKRLGEASDTHASSVDRK